MHTQEYSAEKLWIIDARSTNSHGGGEDSTHNLIKYSLNIFSVIDLVFCFYVHIHMRHGFFP